MGDDLKGNEALYSPSSPPHSPSSISGDPSHTPHGIHWYQPLFSNSHPTVLHHLRPFLRQLVTEQQEKHVLLNNNVIEVMVYSILPSPSLPPSACN